jgi:hypothetical protein
VTYYFDGVGGAGAASFGQAVRWDAGSDVCSLKTISLAIYLGSPGLGTTLTVSAGVTAYVWADDGTGLPGAVISSVNVPHASIVYYPVLTEVSTNVIINGGEYHTGYVPNNAGDTYAALLDDGSGGPNASTSLYIGGSWFGNGGVFSGGDLNWVQEIETCCYAAGPPGVCATQLWHCDPTYYWQFTKFAQRFTADGECTLKTATYFIFNN